MLVAASQPPIEQTNEDVRRLILKEAVENGMGGFMVSCGGYSAAHMAEFLCFSLPPLMHATYIPCVPCGVLKALSHVATAAAEHKDSLVVDSAPTSRSRGPTAGRGAACARHGSGPLSGSGAAGAARHDAGRAPSRIFYTARGAVQEGRVAVGTVRAVNAAGRGGVSGGCSDSAGGGSGESESSSQDVFSEM